MLQNVLQLEHLILKIGHISLTVQDMEVILTSCPQIKSLEINRVVLSWMKDDINNHTGILSLLAAKDDDSTATKTTITYTACFEKLVLKSNKWGDHEHIYKSTWFKYIQCKYTELKHLNMNTVEQTDALSRSLYVPSDSFNLEEYVPFSHLNEISLRTTSLSIATIGLKNYFPQLEQVMPGTFGGKASVIWPQPVEGIPSIALRDIDYISATRTTEH